MAKHQLSMSKTTRSPLQAYLAVFSAALFFFYEFINLNCFDALNEQIRLSYHLNAQTISTLSSMYFLANIFCLIPAGYLLDRYPVKKTILWALTLCIISLLMFAYTTNIPLLYASRLLTGATSTVCLLSCAKLTSRWFPPRQHGFIMGMVITLAMFGGIVAQYLTPIATQFHHWQDIFTILAGIGTLFGLIIWKTVKESPPNAPNETPPKSNLWSDLCATIKNPQIWLAGCYTNLMSIPIVVLGALWARDYLIHVHQVSPFNSAHITAMIFLGVIIGSPCFGALSDRWQQRKIPMILGAIATCTVSMMIYYTHTNNTITLALLFFSLGFCSAAQVITYALVIDISPPHLTAISESVAATIIMSAGSIFQPLFGTLLNFASPSQNEITQHTTQYTASAFQFAYLLLPIAFVISILLALALRPSAPKPEAIT